MPEAKRLIMEYTVIEHHHCGTLIERVNYYISKGWEPLGGVSFSGAGGKCSIPGGYAQAMIKRAVQNSDTAE